MTCDHTQPTCTCGSTPAGGKDALGIAWIGESLKLSYDEARQWWIIHGSRFRGITEQSFDEQLGDRG